MSFGFLQLGLGLGFKKPGAVDGSNWILADGTWNDSGIWIDGETWNDGV